MSVVAACAGSVSGTPDHCERIAALLLLAASASADNLVGKGKALPRSLGFGILKEGCAAVDESPPQGICNREP